MKAPFQSHTASRSLAEQGGVRSVLLPLICFALGLAASGVWFERGARPSNSRQPAPELSLPTKALLEHLSGPVEIRFYALLDAGAPTSLGAFAQRAGQLLEAYQQAAGDKIALTRFDAQTNTNPNAALADGIRGFDLDQGDGCYLGVALSCKGKKEVLPQLSPDWEPALEADLSRAIQRLTETVSGPQTFPPVPAEATIIAEIRQRVPALDSTPLDEGLRILREDSIKEFAAAAGEMQARVQEAQARLLQAKNSASASEQDAALKNLQHVQAEQARKLKEIAASSQIRIETFKRLKAK